MRFIKFIFSHFVIVALSIILQVGAIILFLERLNEFYLYINIFLSITAVIFAFNILNRKMNPDYKIPWLMLVLGIPLVGIVLYFFFSRNYITTKQQKVIKKIRNKNKKYIEISEDEENNNKKLLGSYYGQNKYIENTSLNKAAKNTNITYFKNGELFFDDLIKELKKAKKFIFMEYFIIQEGEMFNTILEILKEKVQEGVDVRLIYDDVGSASKVKIGYSKKIRKYGIKCYVFSPFIPVISGIHNNRDHRKITVIDGKIGYTGGINLADEYINKVHPFGVWKDSSIKLEGEGVKNLTLMFLNTYDVITNTDEDYDEFLNIDYEKFDNKGVVNAFGDGPKPIDNELIGENVYINILNNANDYVYITTPYLIIDYNLINAIRSAALRGVDVRIITPHIPDKRIVFNLTRSYYQELIEVGVKIYEYEPGFVHAKNFVCDDIVGVVGSINLDYRSLVHHYECAAWIFNNPVLYDIKDDFLETQKECIEITKDFKIKWFTRLINYILKFFTPML